MWTYQGIGAWEAQVPGGVARHWSGKHGAMELKDWVAVYGAVTGTAALLLNAGKAWRERPHLRLSCYLARRAGNYLVPYDMSIDVPDEGRYDESPMIAFEVVNDGGVPVVVHSVGGELSNGRLFLLERAFFHGRPSGTRFPLKLEAGESVIVTGAPDFGEDEVRKFVVRGAAGQKWNARPKTFRRQVQAAKKRGLVFPPRR